MHWGRMSRAMTNVCFRGCNVCFFDADSGHPLASQLSYDCILPSGERGTVMKRSAICIAALAALSISTLAASAQTKSGVDKLYILNCGEGVAGDISRWSPGVNVGKSMDFVDNCYLIHHTQGWLLWDTGVTDAIAAMPDGQAPADPA